MSRLTILENIQIASPCDQNWDAMLGDDRTRFCESCSKHVYNISAMTAEEATTLIVATEPRICLRLFKRADGTVLTADCPVGLRRISAGRRVRRALALGLVLPALAVAGVTAKGLGSKSLEPFPTGPGATWDDRIDWALIALGLKTAPPPATMGKMIMGEPVMMPPPPASSVPSNGTTPACEMEPAKIMP